MKALGLLIAAVPFAFGAVRFITTGHDARYLGMAVASELCALVVRNRLHPGVTAMAATACAAAVGVAFGARSLAGIGIVSIAFGLCSALGTELAFRPRTRTTG